VANRKNDSWIGAGFLILLVLLIIAAANGSSRAIGILLFFGAWFGAVAIGAIFYAVYQKWKALNSHCPHGVRGAPGNGNCQSCEAQERHAKDLYRRSIEDRDRRRALEDSAAKLKRTELERLAKEYLPSISELRSLSPQRFEDFIAEMFKALGYEVKQTPYSNDAGRDAELRKEGVLRLLECKRYSEDNNVGRPDIQKFHSAIVNAKAAGGYFVTTGYFSRQATEYAKIQQIETINGDELLNYLIEARHDPPGSDSYRSQCRDCSETVLHSVTKPAPVACPNGHTVAPTITFEDIVLRSTGRAEGLCKRCGKSLRVVSGRRGKFLGCSGFPQCRYTQSIARNLH